MEANIPVTLPQAVRYFDRHGYFITDTGKHLAANTTVRLGPPDRVFQEYRYHEAAPLTLDGQKYYVVISEINVPGLLKKLRALKNFEVVEQGERQ